MCTGNDPNGPLLCGGRYHLFYQHLPAKVQWGWGLCWGHVSSTDMVSWQHHPPAICPTPGGPDADGCFSGCAVVIPKPLTAAQHAGGLRAQAAAAPITSSDQRRWPSKTAQAAAPAAGMHDGAPKQGGAQDVANAERGNAATAAAASGVPVLLYTGVVRRPDAPSGLKPSSLAVSELCYEQQLAAVAADPGEGKSSKTSKNSKLAVAAVVTPFAGKQHQRCVAGLAVPPWCTTGVSMWFGSTNNSTAWCAFIVLESGFKLKHSLWNIACGCVLEGPLLQITPPAHQWTQVPLPFCIFLFPHNLQVMPA